MKNENENLKKAGELLDEGCNKFNKEDFQGAIDKFSKAIELKSNYDRAYSNRGAAKYFLNDTEGAMQDYNKAIELNPRNVNAYTNRATLNQKLKNYQDAIDDCTRAIEIEPTADLYNIRGWAMLDSLKFQSAVEDFNKAIELNSNNAEYYISRGHALLEWAGEDFHKALKIDPDNEEAIFFTDLIDDMHGEV